MSKDANRNTTSYFYSLSLKTKEQNSYLLVDFVLLK